MSNVVRAARGFLCFLLTLSAAPVFAAGRSVSNYNSMMVDPIDDGTFWFTQEYYVSTGARNWATRVDSFKFDSCKPGGR